MKVAWDNIDNSVVVEIGKFTILWNCFERTFCNNNCSPSVIIRISNDIVIDNEKKQTLVDVIKRRQYLLYDDDVYNYVNDGLHPGNAIQSNEKFKQYMQEFIDQSSQNSTIGCLLVIHRIRNNLMHGLKMPDNLNDQYELFKAVNGVLESVERINDN